MGKRYFWLKLKDDFFDERYVKALRRLPQGDSLVIVYLKMQLKSLKTEGIINYEGLLPDSISELAMAIDEDENVVRLAIEALVRFGVVERWENETLYMVAMQELIGSESASAERVRRHRASRSNEKALQSNNEVTKCNTEIDIEKDIDIEIDTDTEEDTQATPEETAPEKTKKEESIDYQPIVNAYNEICTSLPSIRILSDRRKKAIRARLKNYSIDDFTTVFTKAQASDFLSGRSGDWQANFDWLLNENNMIKVLEGNYDNKGDIRHSHEKNAYTGAFDKYEF